MKPMLQRVTVTVTVLSLLTATTDAFGWGAIAHYLVAKQAGEEKGADYRNSTDKVEDYASLPDYVSSREVAWLIPIVLVTSKEFRWSHAVIDQGTVANVPILVYVPKKPAYADPDDGRWPGSVMAGICKKLDTTGMSPEKKWELLNTINGFRAHNAADTLVHFEYFDGATEARSPQERGDAWVIHHGLKEVWADFVLLRNASGGTITWNPNGSITPPTGMSITLKGNAMLMQLAQKAQRKNRNHDRIGGLFGDVEFQVQTVAKITEQITKKNNDDFVGFFSKTRWGTWKAGVKLVRSVYLYDEGTQTWNEVNTNEPSSLREESERLDDLASGLNSEKDHNHQNGLMNTFGKWDDPDVFGKYDDSVTKSKQWMFSKTEVFGS